MLTKLLIGIVVLVFVGAAGAGAYTWTENFEGTLSPFWATSSSGGGFVGVVDDGTGNKAMKVDTLAGGTALAGMLNEGVEGIDPTQEVTVGWRFKLLAASNNFLVVATDFTGGIVNGSEYWCDESSGKLFDVPLNEWVALKYQFVPDGGTTHKIWLNESYIGEFDSSRVPGFPDMMAWFYGDPLSESDCYGAAMWDDFLVTGADRVPEPASSIAVLSGVLGLAGRIRRRR